MKQRRVLDPEKAGEEARKKREKAAESAVNAKLAQSNCVMDIVVNINGGWQPIQTILGLPVAIHIHSK